MVAVQHISYKQPFGATLNFFTFNVHYTYLSLFVELSPIGPVFFKTWFMNYHICVYFFCIYIIYLLQQYSHIHYIYLLSLGMKSL